MREMIIAMGPMFWLILFFATLALAVLAERLFYFHRININSGEFLRGLSALLRSGQYDECLHEARQLPGPMARVVEAVLSRPRLPRHELREIALEASEVEVYRIERNVRTLLVCATVMPLLGVLGTLLALVSFYEQPGVTDGAAAAPVVAATLQQALLLSAAGIALAIPTYIFYMFLASRARKLINQVERAGLECVHIIADARDEALSKKPEEKPAPEPEKDGE
ncbi:MAG: MotA/TolQ/ExbB proton channel family protein [Akkermansia sp.]|nr:MotA/TolQ/ExbB proton channel family protein [Akkermansia sp.]MBQ2868641.1 MotA/TolQ/ExbB proton channel family protein [Akkermansia sp.]